MGTMLYALKQARCTIYELRTDSVLYRPPKRRKVFLEDLQYKDLHLMRNKLEGEAKRLNEWHDMAVSDVDEKLYRIKKSLTEEDQLRCNPKRPSRSCGKINVNFLTWKNLNVEEAENQVIVKRQSLLVLGAIRNRKDHVPPRHCRKTDESWSEGEHYIEDTLCFRKGRRTHRRLLDSTAYH